MTRPSDTGSTVALCAAGATTGVNVLSFSLARPLLGVGTLECELDLGAAPPPAAGTLAALSYAVSGGAPVTYACAILESRPHLGRASVFAVLGAGGLRGTVGAVDYGEVSPRIVVEDLLRDAVLTDPTGAPVLVNGAPVHETGNAAALAALGALPHLARWSRPAGCGRAALDRLAERLGQLTGVPYTWRHLRDGSVWIGADAWPAYSSASVSATASQQPYYIAEPDASGVGVVALDAPDLDPGMTVLAPDDQASAGALRVSSVVYSMTEDGVFRARVTVESSSAATPKEDRSRLYMRRAVESVLPPMALRVPWFATVVTQDSDGAVGVRLEAGAPMLTLAAVPLWLGLPGVTVRVPGGSQCMIEFVGGREDMPVVRGFAQDTAFTSIAFGDQMGGSPGATQPLAREGDSTGNGTLSAVLVGGVVQLTYTPPVGAQQVGSGVQLTGTVTSGAPFLRAGSP